MFSILSAPRRQPVRRRARLSVEELEPRRLLASITAAPPVRLDLVALHELGHALGLPESDDPSSIMARTYNPNYDMANFGKDPAVAQLRALFAKVASSPWKDSLDSKPGDGKVQITVSFMPDGTRTDNGSASTLFATMNRIFGSPAVWEKVFITQLNRWASVSGPDPAHPHIQFVLVADNGAPFNTAGSTQNDPRFGDIRIGARGFDGPARLLSHAYFPSPTNKTAGGDIFFDSAESWGTLGQLGAGGGSAGQTGSFFNAAGNLRSAPSVFLFTDAATVQDGIVNRPNAPQPILVSPPPAVPSPPVIIPSAGDAGAKPPPPVSLASTIGFGTGLAPQPAAEPEPEERDDPPADMPAEPPVMRRTDDAPPSDQHDAAVAGDFSDEPLTADGFAAAHRFESSAASTAENEITVSPFDRVVPVGMESPLGLAAVAVFLVGHNDSGQSSADKRDPKLRKRWPRGFDSPT